MRQEINTNIKENKVILGSSAAGGSNVVMLNKNLARDNVVRLIRENSHRLALDASIALNKKIEKEDIETLVADYRELYYIISALDNFYDFTTREIAPSWEVAELLTELKRRNGIGAYYYARIQYSV